VHQIMLESSLTGVFKLIIYILAIYIVITFISRVILPIIVRNAFINLQKRHQNSSGDFFPNNQKKEGDLTIEYMDNKPDKSKESDNGDYVEYEEIK
jgi:hypothetical protein